MFHVWADKGWVSWKPEKVATIFTKDQYVRIFKENFDFYKMLLIINESYAFFIRFSRFFNFSQNYFAIILKIKTCFSGLGWWSP